MSSSAWCPQIWTLLTSLPSLPPASFPPPCCFLHTRASPILAFGHLVLISFSGLPDPDSLPHPSHPSLRSGSDPSSSRKPSLISLLQTSASLQYSVSASLYASCYFMFKLGFGGRYSSFSFPQSELLRSSEALRACSGTAGKGEPLTQGGRQIP